MGTPHTARMTSRERVTAAVRRKKPDRVPRDCSWGFTPGALETFRRMTGQEDFEVFFGADTRLVGPGPTRRAPDHTRYHPAGVTINEWGIGHLSGGPGSHHFQRYLSPLKDATTVEQILDYPLPDLDAAYRLDPMYDQVREIHAKDLAACGAAAVTIYEVAWQIRGIEETLADMVGAPELVDCLFERILNLRIPMILAMVKAGCDVLILGDDVSTQHGMVMSPATWRRYLKPRMARIIREARELVSDLPVFYHSDGDCSEIVEELIEIGVTVLNPVQPECMDPAVVKGRWGDRLAQWGTIGIQGTLPFGTPEDVRAEVKLRMETAGKDGGLLLGPSHMIEPEVPWENLTALYRAIDELGWYR